MKILFITLLLSVFGAFLSANAQTDTQPQQGTSLINFLCQTLSGIISCDNPPNTPKTGTVPTINPAPNRSLFSDIYSPLLGFNASKNITPVRTTSFDVAKGFDGETTHKSSVILVKTRFSPTIYRIIDGKKFIIPSDIVFASYNFDGNSVVTMTQEQIDSYPRVKLIKTAANKNVYYLTEGGMTRLIPTKKVFDSYTDRNEDVVVINTTEFSFYPQNEYIFNEDTYVIGQARDIYQINSTTKILISKKELTRRGVREGMIAPINQTEFDYYKPLGNSSGKQKSKDPNPSPTQQNVWTEYH